MAAEPTGPAHPTDPGTRRSAHLLEDTALLPDSLPAPLGGYTFVRSLGEGGMGLVYLARAAGTEAPVAIKLLKGLDASARQRFTREARLAARLTHPNIVRVFDVGEDRSQMFLAMEYIEGPTLQQRIVESGPLAEDRALAIIGQVARALHYAHQQGIVHRDVKPGNILMTPEGTPKLADMGLARNLSLQESESLTQSGVLLGSVSYMSPEQMEDPRKADARSDLYSLGATLYHLLTGRLPFEADSVVRMACRHATDPRPDPRDIEPRISEPTVRLFQRMMAVRPADRPADLAEVARACDAGVSLASTRLGTKPAGLPSMRGGPRMHNRLVLATLTLVVVGGGLWVALSGGARANPPAVAVAGKVEDLGAGRRRFIYEFANTAERADWEPVADETGTLARAEIRDGSLWVSGGRPALVQFRLPLRVEQVRVVAAAQEEEMTPHINVYMNADWGGAWTGKAGIACIHRGDGLMFCDAGELVEEGHPPTLEARHTAVEEIRIDPAGALVWSVDHQEAWRRAVSPESVQRTGRLLIGAFEVTVRIDRIEFEGILDPRADAPPGK